jgi:hypothetical protein
LDIQSIVAELKGELVRIGEVIGLLETNAPAKKRVGRPPGSAAAAVKVQTERRGRGLTPAGRRKLSEAMKQRWAKRKGAAAVSRAKVSTATPKPKKTAGITAAGRKKLSDAMKKRWAERKRKGAANA